MWGNIGMLLFTSFLILTNDMIDAKHMKNDQVVTEASLPRHSKQNSPKLLNKGIEMVFDKSGIGLSWKAVIEASRRIQQILGPVKRGNRNRPETADINQNLGESFEDAPHFTIEQFQNLLELNIPTDQIIKVLDMLNQKSSTTISKNLKAEHKNLAAGVSNAMGFLLKSPDSIDDMGLLPSNLKEKKSPKKQKNKHHRPSLSARQESRIQQKTLNV